MEKSAGKTTSESGKSDSDNKKDLGSLEELEEKVYRLQQFICI